MIFSGTMAKFKRDVQNGKKKFNFFNFPKIYGEVNINHTKLFSF